VVNHHGAIDNAEFLQHGGRGGIAVMNVKKMIESKNDNTAAALERHLDTGYFGAVGLVLLPDLFIVGNAESHLTEDGGNRVTFVDRRTGSLRGEVELKLGAGPPPDFKCPAFPVPFLSPDGPPFLLPSGVPFVKADGKTTSASPVALLSPNGTWGCFPDTNGIAIGHSSNGEAYLFTANGGTDDVSVIDLRRALGGDRTAEILRIPTQIGPWGIAASPNRRYIVAANRESQRVALGGRRRGGAGRAAKRLGSDFRRPPRGDLRRAAHHLCPQRHRLGHRVEDAVRGGHRDGRRQRPVRAGAGRTEQ